MNFFSAMLAASTIFMSGVGQAAWTFLPMLRQASNFRDSASMKSTWPLRNERMACDWSLVKNSMCGRRTGFLVASATSLSFQISTSLPIADLASACACLPSCGCTPLMY